MYKKVKKPKPTKERNIEHFLVQVSGNGHRVFKNNKRYDRKRDKKVDY